MEDTPRIEVVENGPYRVSGVRLVRMRALYDAAGDGLAWERGPALEEDGTHELCRCGRSGTMPFCDGSEKSFAFDGTEVADRAPSGSRRRTCSPGPLVLTDDRTLCAHASFCSRGPDNAWSLARRAVDDPDAEEQVVWMVRQCPSGRLQYRVLPDPEPVEEELDPEIGVVEDGPLWVRGRIPVRAADGFEYEVRNRATLCRCGQSGNKPFCDGSHWNAGFKDR